MGIISASLLLRSRLRLVPQGFQNIAEMTIEFVLDLVDNVTQDREQTKKFFPLIATIFIFVILSNWIELVPGLGTVGFKEMHEGAEKLVPFVRSSSADLNMTLALAIVAVVATQVAGIATIGIVRYAKKFFVSPLHKPYLIGTFVGLIELTGEIFRLVSFSFRLFGNIFAGEVLLTVILTLTPYFLPLPFLALEIFVGFIQAMVFSMLTVVFMKMATVEASH